MSVEQHLRQQNETINTSKGTELFLGRGAAMIIRGIKCGLVLLALSCFSAPSFAQGQIAISKSEYWFNLLTDEKRIEIQNDLILTGYYGGMVDGEFGPSTSGAITRFQADNGFSPTGILTDEQQSNLINLAQTAFDNFGMISIDRSDLGITSFLPSNIVAYQREDRYGPAYWSDAAMLEFGSIPLSEFPFRSLYELRANRAGRTVSYHTYNDQRFVISGVADGRYFYEFFKRQRNRSVGYIMQYDNTISIEGGIVSVFLASNFLVTEPTLSAAVEPNVVAASPVAESEEADIAPVASGSGFFFAPQGMLVTNQHVIDDCEAVLVEGYGTAVVLKQDKEIDLAVLQLTDPPAHEWANLRLTAPALGEPIILLGYPLSDILNASLTVATGIVSSENGGGLTDWFMTNAGIQPGNSGGPVVDEDGLVVGVAVAKISDTVLAEHGVVAPNLGFAIKSPVVVDFVSIFARVPAVTELDNATTATIVADARKYTVQLICLK